MRDLAGVFPFPRTLKGWPEGEREPARPVAAFDLNCKGREACHRAGRVKPERRNRPRSSESLGSPGRKPVRFFQPMACACLRLATFDEFPEPIPQHSGLQRMP